MPVISSAFAFRKLHIPGKPFVLANAWDRGSARMLASLGAKAIATSSAAHAFTLGLADGGEVNREQALDHAVDLDDATALPLSADLENGYGHDPHHVAETVTMAASRGLAGCCIEDIMLPEDTPYDFALAVERIEAAAAAARAVEPNFVLTARADGIMLGKYDLCEAIRRLQAFSKAGADVLYAPMPANMEALAQICAAVDKPVNALSAGQFALQSVQEFANTGVARISLGASLARATHRVIFDSAQAIFQDGDMSSLAKGIASDAVDDLLQSSQASSD